VPRDYAWLMAAQDARAVARPVEYCIYADRIQLDSRPDRDYAAILDGVRRISTASAATDSSAWFNDGKRLVRARAKAERSGLPLRLIGADALRLPFPDDAFDAATVAFGVRNLEDLGAGLREFRRVLRPGGCLAILEFSHPTHALLRFPYWIYLRGLLPLIGRLVSRRKGAYLYLAASIAGFPEPESLSRILESEGFREVRFRRLTGGIVAVHEATA